MKKIIIVGAGPGGLAAGMLLSAKGYRVKIVEKQPVIGGRTSKLSVGDYSFDLGPTFLMMPQVLEELFERAGRNLHEYVQMKELSPLYTLKFGDISFTPSRDVEATKAQIKELFPGDEESYERFLRIEGEKFDRVTNLLKQPFTSLGDFFTKDMWRALPKLNALDTVYGRLSKYFSDERLKWAFSFQAKYLGMSPWDCPGTFTILSYLEHRYGLYHPTGGVNQICEAMASVIEEYGGDIYTNAAVDKIIVEDGEAKGVTLSDGEEIYADDVIINADFGYTMTHLFDQSDLTKYRKARLEKKSVSCSTFMVYLGIDRELDLPHHLIFFADDYKKNVMEITKQSKLSDDPSIYVHNPSVIDKTLAPEGKTALYLLMPVPNLDADIDWEEQREVVKDKIITKLAQQPGLADIRDWIEVEKVITPADWEADFHVYKGATFNLSHSLDQMMYFRPHNKFEDVDHCYLVGGGTHPGSGLPTIFQSAMISTDLLIAEHENDRKANADYNRELTQ
ncbi:phytoene desaturase family protein [Radiobacillus sp. PE A8.2]|uniref:phytoene desaturase family protein n=1 Tax=Radiobacillus sp. PE A8.2 TaxID=3380349 RepID=UPI00388D12B2